MHEPSQGRCQGVSGVAGFHCFIAGDTHPSPQSSAIQCNENRLQPWGARGPRSDALGGAPDSLTW
jgi:hypothetical protein